MAKRKTARCLVVSLMLSLVACGGGSTTPTNPDPNPPTDPNDPAVVEAGQALFGGRLGCYVCHGREGEGGIGPALNDAQWIYGSDEADVIESITNGRPGGMRAYGDLATPEQIQQVAAFVLSLSNR